MDPLAALFGCMCVVTTILAVHADDEDWHDAVVCSALLTASWAASNMAWLMDVIGSLPLLDAALGVYFFTLALSAPWGWRGGLFLAILSQLIMHVVYAVLGDAFYTPYAILLNATFGLQLLIVASTGGKRVRDHLSRLCGHLRRPRRSAEP